MIGRTLMAIGGAAILVAAAGSANAGERIEFAGTEGCSTKVLDELELDEGHFVVLFHDGCVHIADDPESDAHLQAGNCIGIYEERADGTYSANGFCTYVNRDGSKEFDKFWETSEMEAGRWEIIGGNGKLAGATGGGTYSGGELTDTLSYYRVDGVIELK